MQIILFLNSLTPPPLSSRYITQEGNRLVKTARPPAAVTNVVSWRSEGIKHRKNEIFLDVVEKLNLLVAANGNVLHSEIIGAVKMKSMISGMPELKLCMLSVHGSSFSSPIPYLNHVCCFFY